MRITYYRLLSAYSFLACDSIELFQDELWLNFLKIDETRKIIRENIKAYLESKTDIFGDSLLITSKINYLLRQLLKEKFYKLEWWIRNVYVRGGDDRLSEEMWSTCCIKVVRKIEESKKLKEALTEKVLNVGTNYLQREKNIKEKYNRLKPQFYSQFNVDFIELLGHDEDIIETTISLIAGYNAFAELWNKELINTSYEELLDFFNFGKCILPKIMPKVEISFPGDWTYELNEYSK